MKVLNLLATGNVGGIEVLCNNIDISQKFDNYWCFLFGGGKIAEKIKKRNEDKTFIFEYSKKNFKKRINKIIKICNENKVDIITIHHGGTYCNIIYCELKRRLKHVKFIRFLHSCYEEQYNLSGNFIENKLNLYFINKALKKSDLIICVSKAVKETYKKKFHIKEKKIKVIYNGIPDGFLKGTKNVLKNEQANYIYIGRLEKVKGIDLLIDAFNKVLEKEPNAKLTIVGDGQERRKLEEQAKNLAIWNKVEFTGTKDSIKKYLDKADIFIYPSVWKEAFGISVVEAMARGCIPITFNKGGLVEIIENQKNGYIVEKIESEELAKTMLQAINNSNGEKIIQNAQETAKKFLISKTIIKLKEAYHELIE